MAALAAKDEELAQGVAALATKDDEEEEEEVTIAVGGKRVFLGTQLTAAAFNAANSTAALRSSADALDCTGFRLWTDCTTRAIKFVEGCCEVSGRRVLELGCGAHAALATACAELGAAATATDGKDETVARARRNFALRRARDPKCKHVAFETLRWGGAAAEKRYDLVVGSELMYFSTPIDDLVDPEADRTALACQEELALGFKTYFSVLQGFPVDLPGVKVIRSSPGVGKERLLQVFAHLRVDLPPGSAAAR